MNPLQPFARLRRVFAMPSSATERLFEIPFSPHPEEPRSGVSKDAPGGSGTIWSILRDAA